MFNHIKDSYLDENIFAPASEQAMQHIIDDEDVLKEEFDCEECDNKKVCELINSIPDQIFDKEEFDKKIDDIIETLPVDKEECCKESSLLDELILL